MRKKLNCILLIDDSEADNYLHELIIEEVDCTEHIHICQSAMEALDFLKTESDGKFPKPDLIFLDINMPGMSGWDFLEKYKLLPEDQKGHILIFMLTTSINTADREKSMTYQEIVDYMNKPLTVDMLNEILKENFPEKF